jgi:uncharacterized RDD family membrane protein YckC
MLRLKKPSNESSNELGNGLMYTAQMDANSLSLPQNNVLDLRLSVAGPGARTLAFVLDFKFRILAAMSYFSLAALVNALIGDDALLSLLAQNDETVIWAVVVPMAVIYFLYHPLFELLWRGRTPGKKLAGLRIVDGLGRAPSVSQTLIRNVFRPLDSVPFGYGLGLSLTLLSARRQRLGDLAADTYLVHDGMAAKPLRTLLRQAQTINCDLAQFELAQDLIARWDGLLPNNRNSLAHALFAHAGIPVPPNDGMFLAELKRIYGR